MDKDTGNFDTWILIHKFLGRKRNGKKYGRGIGLSVDYVDCDEGRDRGEVCASELNAHILKVHIENYYFFFKYPHFRMPLIVNALILKYSHLEVAAFSNAQILK